MSFDPEGHVLMTPGELDAALCGAGTLDDLVYSSFLRGTPRVFPTHAQHCAFLRSLSDALRVHPQNICVRGSAWFGFSTSPNEEKVWALPGPDSDIDVAFVDSSYYEQIEADIRQWERELARYTEKVYDLRNTRRFFYYRYFDLPDIEIARRHNDAFARLPVEALCGLPRPVNAFIYKDWWSVVERIKYDLTDLRNGLRRGALPRGGDAPRERPLPQGNQPRNRRRRRRR